MELTNVSGVIIAALMMSLLFLEYAEGCSCMMQHPQEQYCNSDFVILGRVKREQISNSTHLRIYKVNIKKIFKISEKGVVALKSGRIITPLYDSMCGTTLPPGKLYVISGRIVNLKPLVSLCDMTGEWRQYTKRQQKGLRLLYKHGCSCHIKSCFFGRCQQPKDSCAWKNDCETNEGICLRRSDHSCMWSKTKKLAECRRKYRNSTRQWSFRPMLIEP